MTRLAILVWLCGMGAAVEARTWTRLSGDEIREALNDRKLRFDTAWQEFSASGRTLHNARWDSWGYWRIENNQYCSMWPPSDLWACYHVVRSGDQLRFIWPGGDVTDAVYADD